MAAGGAKGGAGAGTGGAEAKGRPAGPELEGAATGSWAGAAGSVTAARDEVGLERSGGDAGHGAGEESSAEDHEVGGVACSGVQRSAVGAIKQAMGQSSRASGPAEAPVGEGGDSIGEGEAKGGRLPLNEGAAKPSGAGAVGFVTDTASRAMVGLATGPPGAALAGDGGGQGQAGGGGSGGAGGEGLFPMHAELGADEPVGLHPQRQQSAGGAEGGSRELGPVFYRD
jgi:hypothetical protein